MEPDLISKRELLAEARISYGQLYRWKRKGLIPEEWFLRRATFTGQETFFPRERTLARVRRILAMKDEDLSLDDIADAVSPDLADVAVSLAGAVGRGLLSSDAVDALAEAGFGGEELRKGELLSGMVHDTLLASGEASLEEGRLVVRALAEGYSAFEGRPCDLVFVRKRGIATCLLVSSSAEVRFEGGARVVARIDLQGLIDELDARLQKGSETA